MLGQPGLPLLDFRDHPPHLLQATRIGDGPQARASMSINIGWVKFAVIVEVALKAVLRGNDGSLR